MYKELLCNLSLLSLWEPYSMLILGVHSMYSNCLCYFMY
jgi:hypothetical protein